MFKKNSNNSSIKYKDFIIKNIEIYYKWFSLNIIFFVKKKTKKKSIIINNL